MRIIHVLPSRNITFGGPVHVAESLAQLLTEKGHPADVVPSKNPKGKLYWPGIRGMTEIKGTIAEADLVHVHGLWTIPTTVAMFLARQMKRPYVVSVHGMLDRWSLHHSRMKKRIFAALLERRSLNCAAAIHFTTKDEADEARDFQIRTEVFVVPNAVHTEEFAGLPSRTALNSRYPHLKGKVLSLFLGRIHPKKGLGMLVPAVKLAQNKCPSLHLLVAGPDESGYRCVVEQAIREANLTNAVDFLGVVSGEAKRLVLGGADFFVLPSYQEGDSIAVKEALAAGLPVIASSACRCDEIARQGAGIIVDMNVAAIAESLLGLAADVQMRESMGKSARKLALARYDWQYAVNKFVEIYADILSGRRASDCWLPTSQD